MASQITSVSIVCSTVCSGTGQRKRHSPKFHVTGLCEGNPSVTSGFLSQRASNAENVPFDDVIMFWAHDVIQNGRHLSAPRALKSITCPAFRVKSTCAWKLCNKTRNVDWRRSNHFINIHLPLLYQSNLILNWFDKDKQSSQLIFRYVACSHPTTLCEIGMI